MISGRYVDVAMKLPKQIYMDLQRKGYLEVVMRDLNKRYKPFVKLGINSFSSNSETTKRLFSVIDQFTNVGGNMNPVGLVNTGLSAVNLAVTQKGFERMGRQLLKIASIGYLNAALSAVNVVVNVTGFVIINNNIKKLNKTIDGIASKIDRIEAKLDNAIIQEYQEIALQFTNFTTMVEGYGITDAKVALDWLSRAQPFMNKIINNMASDAMDKGLALDILFTLMPAYTAVLIMMIREYRFSTGRTFGVADSYIQLYNQMLNTSFMDEVADYNFLNEKKHMRDALEAVQGQSVIITENLSQIHDEMKLMEVLKTREDFGAYSKAMYDSIREVLDEHIPEVAKQSEITEAECAQIVEKAFTIV